MLQYKLKVLFKNGIEKEFEMVSGEENLQILMGFIEQGYTNDISGVLTLGYVYIRLSETICIEIINLCEYDINKHADYNNLKLWKEVHFDVKG